MAVVPFPPGPPERFPAQGMIAFRRDSLGFLTELRRRYGDIAHFQVGREHFYLISRPEWIGDILVTHQRNFHKSRALQAAKRVLGEGLLTSEGEFHLRQRRLAQPAFHRRRIAGYAESMIAYAERTRKRWKHGEVLDIDREMMRLTLAIVGKTLFDADVEGEAEEVGAALTNLMELFPFTTLPFYSLVEKLPIPAMQRAGHALATLDALIYRMIAERRASGEDTGDLLSMLLLAQDEEGTGGMTDQQVRDEALTLFLAGHETTANALTWTFYLLSQHPAVAEQLHAEVDRVLGGKLPTPEDMPRLVYTRQVLAESLRLYPPAWTLGRLALNDYHVGGYTIPAGSIVLMSQWVVQRDARFFPDPLRFDPARWTPEAQAARPKFSYFPFGGGTRLCIGEQFAWTEGVLLLATLVQQWQLRLVPGHPVDTRPLVTLRPRHGMRMVAERRVAKGELGDSHT